MWKNWWKHCEKWTSCYYKLGIPQSQDSSGYFMYCIMFILWLLTSNMCSLHMCTYCVCKMCGLCNTSSADTTRETCPGKPWKGQRQRSFQSTRLRGGSSILFQVKLLKHWLKKAFYISWGRLCFPAWHFITLLSFIEVQFHSHLPFASKCFSINLIVKKGLFLFLALHYRSLSIMSTVAAYNNRAQAEINLKHWHNAMRDCQRVLELEPGNMKGDFPFM